MAAEDATPSLLELAKASVAAKGPRCTVALEIENHPELADQITELIAATPTIPYSTASNILQAAGVPLKADTVSRHRRGECACPKP